MPTIAELSFFNNNVLKSSEHFDWIVSKAVMYKPLWQQLKWCFM